MALSPQQKFKHALIALYCSSAISLLGGISLIVWDLSGPPPTTNGSDELGTVLLVGFIFFLVGVGAVMILTALLTAFITWRLSHYKRWAWYATLLLACGNMLTIIYIPVSILSLRAILDPTIQEKFSLHKKH